jgi:basic membrane protein A and related proteins
MTRKLKFSSIVILVCFGLLAGCFSDSSSNRSPGGTGAGEPAATDGNGNTKNKKIRVVHYVSGKLGDKGFFDSAERGLQKANYIYGYDTSTVVGGEHAEEWAAGLEKLAASGVYSIILVGTTPMRDVVIDLARRYPNQRFIFYDDRIEGLPNVYAMSFSQSEGSFLAGAFAAMVTTESELKGTNKDKTIGFIGGMKNEVIADFLDGYKQGAAFIDPEVKIVEDYVGDFLNESRAEKLALQQFRSEGVDIIYNVAGGAGLGILKAGNKVRKYTIGVDSNQNPLYPGSVLTSMLKNLDESVFRALSLERGGNLPYGKWEVLGVKEGCIGIARDKLYEQYVPESIKVNMKDIEGKIANGEIQVLSYLKKEVQ